MPKVANDADRRPNFVERVYVVVAQIPYGRVTTYGAIARSLGEARSARMVGWAVNSPPPELDLPCHRVVNRIGYLSGGWHFGHPDIMRNALLEERITFVDEYQVDLTRHFWDPSLESAASDEVDDLEDIPSRE
jgi:methylated-DNA-protein-cysteine methyltransferase related protein